MKFALVGCVEDVLKEAFDGGIPSQRTLSKL